MAEAKPIKGQPLPDEKIGGEDAELLRIARERYQRAADAEFDNREWAEEDLEFLAGEQWPDELVRQRQEDGRPCLTVNRLPQFVHQVSGDIRQNKPSIKIRPGDDNADDEIAEIYEGLIRHIEAQSDAGAAYHLAAEQAAQCGIGHFRINTEYSSDDTFDQDIRIRRITNFRAVTWDPDAVEINKADARYCFVEETLGRATFEARYPKADTSGFDFTDSSNQQWLGDWFSKDNVRVAEYWTKTPEQRLLVLLDDGRTLDATDTPPVDGFVFDGAGNSYRVLKSRKVFRNKVEMRLITGTQVLEGPYEWAGRHIPIVPVVGEEIYVGHKLVRHGVVRFAKDPQRLYNIWRSAQTEKIALEPKAPFMVTATNIEGYKHLWEEANRRNLPYLPYTPDSNNRGAAPQRNAPQMGSQSIHNEVLLAADDMKGVIGIYDPGLGQRSNETSGKAILARQRESDTGTFTYADNLSRALRHAGHILVDLIPRIYDTERVVRVLGEDDSTKMVPINQPVQDPETGETRLLNDISRGEYDVVVVTGPSYGTKRAEASEGMLGLAQAVPDKAALFLDILVSNLDWPGADEIAERLRKTLPPGLVEPKEGEEPPPPPPPTPEQIQAQAEVEANQREQAREDAETAAGVEKTKAETEGKQLENMRKAVELAVQGGAIERMVTQQVEAAVARVLGGGDGQQQPVMLTEAEGHTHAWTPGEAMTSVDDGHAHQAVEQPDGSVAFAPAGANNHTHGIA